MDTEMMMLMLLGFPQNLQEIPSLLNIKKHFRKECLLKHPDKPCGDNLAFQELLVAYNKIVRKIHKRGDIDEQESDSEEEETLKQNYFKEYSLYGN